jgi:hypothetical protein
MFIYAYIYMISHGSKYYVLMHVGETSVLFGIHLTSNKDLYDLLKSETFGSIQHFAVHFQFLYIPHFLRHTECISKWVSLYSLGNRYFSVRSIVCASVCSGSNL